MKRVKFFYCLYIGLALTVFPVLAQNKQLKKEVLEQQIKDEINEGNYIIEINKAYPAGGRTVDLTSGYHIEIKNDSLVSDLPYFGKAGSIPYGGGKGLIFNSPLTKYKAVYHPKRRIKIDFSVINEEDTYFFHLIIYQNAKAYLTVYPVNRQMISYTGYLRLPTPS